MDRIIHTAGICVCVLCMCLRACEFVCMCVCVCKFMCVDLHLNSCIMVTSPFLHSIQAAKRNLVYPNYAWIFYGLTQVAGGLRQFQGSHCTDEELEQFLVD